MSTTSQFAETLRRAFEPTSRGVVGVVDELLTLCQDTGLQLDWHADRCQVRSCNGQTSELLELPLPKSVFRAILARLAAFCNEHKANSVSPYGGQGTFSVGVNPARVYRATFANTPDEQKLELMCEHPDEQALRHR